mgnify:FL=1|jgi:hypothetical protein|tara:strand:+ start:5722 stop:6153 length:432 start_codon:yes stop_codon:yes gene_type:complete
MPLYCIECPKCGIIDDVFAKRATEGFEYPCPECGTTSKKLPTTFATAGIIFSNPLVINSAGLKAESNSEARKYLKDNPGTRFVDRKSSYWQNKVERLHERRNDRVKSQGYKNWNEFQTEKKAQRADKSIKSDIFLDTGAKNAR